MWADVGSKGLKDHSYSQLGITFFLFIKLSIFLLPQYVTYKTLNAKRKS